MTIVELEDLKRSAHEAWAAGDYPSIAQRQLWDVGQRIVEALEVQRVWHRERRHSRGCRGRARGRARPDPRAARRGAAARGEGGCRCRLGRGGCGGAAVRRRELRSGRLDLRLHVRSAARRGGARDRPRPATRWKVRDLQLDARKLHRRPLPDRGRAPSPFARVRLPAADVGLRAPCASSVRGHRHRARVRARRGRLPVRLRRGGGRLLRAAIRSDQRRS